MSGGGAFRSAQRDFELALHVGHVKTASTWLQQVLFENPESGFVTPWDDSGGRAAAAFLNANSYREDAREARSYFDKGLQACARSPRIPVLSEENLCGNPLQRQYTGRHVADRIHACFPSARILIGVREQQSIALSLYKEYLLIDGCLPLEALIGTGDEPLGYTPILQPDFLEYDRVVAYYQELYGREAVLVLPIERLRQDAAGYVKTLLEFCGCSGALTELPAAKRTAQAAAVLALRRRINPWLQGSPLAPWPSTRAQRVVLRATGFASRNLPASLSAPLDRRWRDSIARRYAGRFAASNQRLTRLTGIDFAALGYET